MKVWIGGELEKEIHENYRIIRNQIEKSLNAYIKEIGYNNEQIKKLRVVFILRNDSFSVMKEKEGKVGKDRGEPIYGVNLRLDYNEFKNGDENIRKKMIYEGLLKAFSLVEEQRKIKNLDTIKEYIKNKIEYL